MTRKLVCSLLLVALIMQGCSRDAVKPPSMADMPALATPAPEPSATAEATADPQEDSDFVSIATTPVPTPTPTLPPKPTPKVIIMTEIDENGNPVRTSPQIGEIVGQTAYNEHQDDKMREMAVAFGKMSLLDPPYCETYVESFRYAAWPQPGDYSVQSDKIPDWQNEEPVNRWSGVAIDAEDSLYQTNADVINEIGQSEAQKMVDIARYFTEIDCIYNYTSDNVQTLMDKYSKCFPSNIDITQKAEDTYGYIVANELIGEGFVTTDTTQIYRDSEGTYRVRVGLYKHILHASDKVYATSGYSPNCWVNIDVEVLIGVSDGERFPLLYNKLTPFVIISDTPGNRAVIEQSGYTL